MTEPSFTGTGPSLLTMSVIVETMEGSVSIPLRQLDKIQSENMLLATLFAVRISTTLIVMIWYFVAVSKTKRSKLLYIVNHLSLFFVFIQSLLFLGYIFSNFSKMSTILTASYASITQTDINVSCAASVFQFLFVACIELALFIQATVVFTNSVKWLKYTVTLLQGSVALTTTMLYMAIIVQTIHSTLNPYDQKQLIGGRFGYLLASLGKIFFSISVTTCMIIFVGKLVFTIHQRRTMGIKQFDGLQILVIMSTQSMIIPTILVLLSFVLRKASTVHNIATFLVALSLPLSSLWAEARTTRDNTSYTGYRSSESPRRRSRLTHFVDRLVGSHHCTSDGGSTQRKANIESTIEISSCYTESPTNSQFDTNADPRGLVYYNGMPVSFGGDYDGKMEAGRKYEVNTTVVLSDMNSQSSSPTDITRN